MAKPRESIRFEAKLQAPAQAGGNASWAFLVLPREASERLPRRGRTTVRGTLDGQPFQATLEPDGQLSHWLKVDRRLREAAGARIGDSVRLEVSSVQPEPDPRPPADLDRALTANPAARANWEATTSLARVDWIHWIVSAKLQKTRASRIEAACDMLAKGKKRVCCFDPSGYYSKSFSAPEAKDV
jgi:hypothetical protein